MSVGTVIALTGVSLIPLRSGSRHSGRYPVDNPISSYYFHGRCRSVGSVCSIFPVSSVFSVFTIGTYCFPSRFLSVYYPETVIADGYCGCFSVGSVFSVMPVWDEERPVVQRNVYSQRIRLAVFFLYPVLKSGNGRFVCQNIIKVTQLHDFVVDA